MLRMEAEVEARRRSCSMLSAWYVRYFRESLRRFCNGVWMARGLTQTTRGASLKVPGLAFKAAEQPVWVWV